MNIYNKDVYEYILNLPDDKTILNMLSVNKGFHDDDFFRKYPFLVGFKDEKSEKETWKHLFLRMVKYIAKLEEVYGIPYIPAKKYNPENFYNLYNNYGDYDEFQEDNKFLVEL